ncbi:hypothetical protein Pint_27245 [Pistacia integerrima]|uniref:Uncharacterized protein n=1 Tax=Pistacia integerrima TaxID=434235 RepID=A0ACC0YRH2_9ROSI|nr:hypothetical protein Pint_27245 [Pistacia integerrima]
MTNLYSQITLCRPPLDNSQIPSEILSKMILKTSLVSSLKVRFLSLFVHSSVSKNQLTKSVKHTSAFKHHAQLENFLRVNCRSGAY